jgi:hypothetical protein
MTVPVWPSPDEDSVPSPVLVAAWARLNMLPTEKVPLWAAYWIAAGQDGEHIVHLAGLHGDDPHDVHDALPGALEDCGVPWPDSDAAAATVAFTHLARVYLDGQAVALWIAQKVDEMLARSGYSESVMALPLGKLFCIADEWGAGWGRTKEQHAAVVHEACEEQLLSGWAPA